MKTKMTLSRRTYTALSQRDFDALELRRKRLGMDRSAYIRRAIATQMDMDDTLLTTGKDDRWLADQLYAIELDNIEPLAC